MALIQATAKLQSQNFSGVQTYTNAFASNITAGSTLIVILDYYDGASGAALSSVTIGGDTASVDYTFQYNSNIARLVAYRVQSATGGSNRDVVVTPGAGNNKYLTLTATEWDQFDSSPLDETNGATTGTSSPSISTSNATDTADQVVFAWWGSSISEANLGISSPASSGYTSLYVEQDSANNSAGEASYKVVSTTGTQSASWTKTTSSSGAAAIVTYRLQAAPASGISLAWIRA